MADYTFRTITSARREYALPASTNWTEVSKVFAVMRNELGEDRARWDTAVMVEARDEEIVFWYDLPREAGEGLLAVLADDVRLMLATVAQAPEPADETTAQRVQQAQERLSTAVRRAH